MCNQRNSRKEIWKKRIYKICRNCLFFLELFVFIKNFRRIKPLPNKYGHQLAGITFFLPTVPNIPANDIYVRL